MLLNDPDDGKTAEITEATGGIVRRPSERVPAPSADDREGGSWNIT